jgi:hypothetical protein
VRDQERSRLAIVARGREHGERAALLGTERHRPGNSARSRVGHLPNVPPFVIASLDPVEELPGLLVGKHHADITGRNPRGTLRVKFMALDKRHAFVNEAASTMTTPCNRPRRL